MDDSFQLCVRDMLAGRRPAPLAHDVLAALLIARQTASPAACAQSRAGMEAARSKDTEPLIELLLAGPDWQRAASAQAGCFSRVEAGRRINSR